MNGSGHLLHDGRPGDKKVRGLSAETVKLIIGEMTAGICGEDDEGEVVVELISAKGEYPSNGKPLGLPPPRPAERRPFDIKTDPIRRMMDEVGDDDKGE